MGVQTMQGQQHLARERRIADAPRAAGEDAESSLVSAAVRRAKAGDRDALAFLYVRYADDICGYLRSIVHDEHLAEDITQQVFAKLIRVIGKYEERGLPFFAWMLRVARNVAVDQLRRQDPIPVEEVRLGDERSQRESIGRERAGDLKDALAALPAAQREVLVLRHIAGLSPTEIAECTGRTEASVHGLHHRGRKDLVAELSRRGAAPVTAGSAHDQAPGA
jgi:RNA polymerase sigma-70 factor (ECF subfamily)